MIIQTVPLNNGIISANSMLLPDEKLLVTGLTEAKAGNLDSTNGITVLFQALNVLPYKKIFIDLKNIRLLTSFSWGVIFTQIQKMNLKEVWFFNASKAIVETAQQMGIDNSRKDRRIRSKIMVLLNEDNAEVLQILDDYKKWNKPS